MTAARGWLFAVFAASGFAGLIYESLWSHYLRLFLGHAAYAQTLVLAIMMGGMALGAWACGRYIHRWRNLLLGYALAEAAIGVLAIAFHAAFVAATDVALAVVIPALGSPLAVGAFQWILSAALILPQAVLLGMTFPLMSAGIMRAFPDRSGGTVAMLYFTNSFGAALGVLASGFFLIRAVGLPGTVLTAGLINIALALIVWPLAKALPQRLPASVAGAASSAGAAHRGGYRLMLCVSLLTGMASFMYEIGWIRMLSMVLGSSTHAFELMLSAFILGLAFGGIWIKRRIGSIGIPETVLGIVQVAMGVLALATLVVYGHTFGLMQALLETVARTDQGYAAFNFGGHLIALLVMFPPAFCAGMTLPLITHVALTQGNGERAIGAVYAANTVGAIAGVALATHLAMPALGLKGLITFAAAIDIGLGLVLLWRFPGARLNPVFATALGGACIAGTLAWVELDSLKMASGVYREGRLIRHGDAVIAFHRDGRTATVNLVRQGDRLSITTNGKSDAMMNLSPGAAVGDDEPVMVMLGALPLLVYPQARTAAVIGMGSGISSHVLLASDLLRVVDTIEIEPAIVEAARGFQPFNAAVFGDPRSRIHIEDAKTFFAAHGKRYDLIVSEPSNPWVSGVASLFSDEFYRRIGRHLEPGGLFVQWLQLYELQPALVASVVNALARNFQHYEIYAPDDGNLIIIARADAPVPPATDAAFGQPKLATALARLQVRSAADVDVFRVGSKQALQPYFDRYSIVNSDYFPVLDQNAAKSHFMNANAYGIAELASLPIPAIDFLDRVMRRAVPVPSRPWQKRSEFTHAAQRQAVYLTGGDEMQLEGLPAAWRSEVQLLRRILRECSSPRSTVTVDQLFSLAERLLPYLAPGESGAIWRKLSASPCLAGESQASWLALFLAVDGRDSRAIAGIAESMLAAWKTGPAAHGDYLLCAAIIGSLGQGERDKAVSLWQEYSRLASSERHKLLRDFLQGHLRGRSGNPLQVRAH